MKTFIDIFAGLGGFHLGLTKAGYHCVFAAEIDKSLASLYEKNFGLQPVGDIRNVDVKEIPKHDVLCAGFPCQPFSSAGKKKGSKCPESGKLIDEVVRIAAYHHPEYILLENVPQIITIQNGEFWEHIHHSFKSQGYTITHNIYSPRQFGIPQNRKRVFVVASKKHIIKLEDKSEKISNIDSILIPNIEHRALEPVKIQTLTLWQNYLDNVKHTTSSTVLAAEFGATYPLEDLNKIPLNELRSYKGAFGVSLYDCKSYAEVFDKLPEYVTKNQGKIPQWVLIPIKKSRDTYSTNQEFLDVWKKNIPFNTSWQKFEWRAGSAPFNIFDNIIQFRASGIRVSRPTHTPSLVAMTPTQIPIIGKLKRYLSPKEAAKLQALEELNYFFMNNTQTFKALGNAVNAKIVNFVSKQLVWE